MQRSGLVGRLLTGVRVVVTRHAEIVARLGPDVIRLGRMNVLVVSAAGDQNIVVGRGIGNLLTDVNHRAVHGGDRGSVYEAVDEGRVRILQNLLRLARKLVLRLGPVVILHRDHENALDLLRAGAKAAQCSQESQHAQYLESSALRH